MSDLGIISVHSHKGGVGKSSIALACAAALAEFSEQEDKICLVDLDLSGPALRFYWPHDGFDKEDDLAVWIDPLTQRRGKFDDYIYQPPRSATQQEFLQGAIHLAYCKPTSFGLDVIDRAYHNLKSIEAVHAALIGLIRELEDKGYRFLVIDNAPGLRDFSLHIYSITHTHSGNNCPVIVSSPAEADIGGIFSQLDTLFPEDSPRFRIQWIVNFLHAGGVPKDYQTVPRLATLAQARGALPQGSEKAIAKFSDDVKYRYLGYDERLARLNWIGAGPRNDWYECMRAAHSFYDPIREMVKKEFSIS